MHFLKGFADLGFVPPALFWWGSLVVEMFGGICIILGLFTRLAAAAAAIEMLCIFDRLLGQRLRLDEARL